MKIIINWISNHKKNIKISEKEKIKFSILTDFFISIEIIIIILQNVINESFLIKLSVISFVSLFLTIGFYGLVILIIRIYKLGLSFLEKYKNYYFNKKIINESELFHFNRNININLTDLIFINYYKKLGIILINNIPIIIKLLNIIVITIILLISGDFYSQNINYFNQIINLNENISFLINSSISMLLGTFIIIIFKIYKDYLKKYINI